MEPTTMMADIKPDEGLIGILALILWWAIAVGGIFGNWAIGLIPCLLDMFFFPAPAYYTMITQYVSCILNPYPRLLYDIIDLIWVVVVQMQIQFMFKEGK